jgi:hypothetical protein
MRQKATRRQTWPDWRSQGARTDQVLHNSQVGHGQAVKPKPASLDGHSQGTQTADQVLENSHDNINGQVQVTGTRLSNRFRLLLWTICAYVAMTPLAVLLFYYVMEVLVSPDPHIGRLHHSPARTLLLVTIFTQTFLVILHFLMNNVFDALRWQLASMQNGLDFCTFLALGNATSLYGALMLLTVRGRHHAWALQKYSPP